MNDAKQAKKYLLQLMIFGLVVIFLHVKSNAQSVDTIVPIKTNPEEILKNIRLKTFSGKSFNYWQDKFSGHWMGIDLGFNALINGNYSGYESEFMENDILNSNSLHLNIIQQSVSLQRLRNNFGLVAGLGVQMQEYRLDDNTTIVKSETGVVTPKTFNISDNQKSKLFVYSVVVPVLAEYQVPVKDYKSRFYISAGFFAGYSIASYTKIKYETDEKEKLKRTGNYSLQNFKYGLMVRTGYRWFNVFCMYEFTTLFKENMGPELTPLTFGVTILPF